MNATASLNMKIEPEAKERFVQITESLGMTPSGALKTFVYLFNEHGGFPFEVRASETASEDTDTGSRIGVAKGRLLLDEDWDFYEDDKEIAAAFMEEVSL